MKVFIDLDGVMADFDKRAIEILGVRPRDFEGQQGADKMWEAIDAYPNFFLSLEPMVDAMELWNSVEALGFTPTVLTGTPRWINKGNMDPSEQKRQWVLKHLNHGRTITCKSRDKCLHMERPGDVLIDDWHKYKHLWEAKGGKFILHTSASDSLKQLRDYVAADHLRWLSIRLGYLVKELGYADLWGSKANSPRPEIEAYRESAKILKKSIGTGNQGPRDYSEFFRTDLKSLTWHAIEEAGEVLAALGKTGRWGLDSYNPLLPESERESNRDWLLREMRDLDHVLDHLLLALAV